MDYENHYQLLIAKRGRAEKPDDGVYYERHHIIPRAHGGSDDDSNLVYLTGREHYIAHWLLWKIHRDMPMAAAFWAMATGWGDERRGLEKRVTSSIAFEAARKAHAENQSTYQSWYKRNHYHQYRGKKLSAEHIAKRTATCKERNITPTWMYKKRATCTHCGVEGNESNIIRWHNDNCPTIKPRKKIQCEHCLMQVAPHIYVREHGNKCKSKDCSCSVCGAKDTLKRLKLYHNENCGRSDFVTCPYCEKSGGLKVMKRWHFDNCKHKPD
jgi:hypothetical protein